MVALAVVALIVLVLTVEFLLENGGWAVLTTGLHPGACSARVAEWLTSIPSGFVVHPGHVWSHRRSDGLVRVGSDGFATALLGEPEAMTVLAQPGAVRRGQPLMLLARQGRSLTLRSPVDGTLLEWNRGLDAAAVAGDPFGRGWLASIQPRLTPAAAAPDEFEYGDFLAREWDRVRAFVADRGNPAAVGGVTMADGGALQPGFLPQLPAPLCAALAEAFFAIAPDPAPPESGAEKEARR